MQTKQYIQEMTIESALRARILQNQTSDPAHDVLHLERVVAMAKKLAEQEGGNLAVVIPAAWLHDFIVIPKNDPRRSQASRISAVAAIEFLRSNRYEERLFPEISHAIEAHSYSAGIECKTLEAKIVQDADRLDGVGAIGIARCFATAGLLKRPFYSPDDPFCEKRIPNDSKFTVDHFYQKLFRTVETLQTESGRKEGQRRADAMARFLTHMKDEISCLQKDSSRYILTTS